MPLTQLFPLGQANLICQTVDKVYLIDTLCLYNLAYIFVFVAYFFKFLKISLDKIFHKCFIKQYLQRNLQ